MTEDKNVTHVTPDHNTEAERGVIEAILSDDMGEAFFIVFEKVKDHRYFSIQTFRDIYKTVCNLFVTSAPLDYINIKTSLESQILPNGKSKLEDMGGEAELQKYIFHEGFINLAAVASWAQMVADSYMKRLSMSVAQETTQNIATANGSLESVIDEVKNRWGELQTYLAAESDSKHPWEGQVKTLRDLRQKPPPTEYVVGGFLEKGKLVLFFGAPGSLKTMILLDMALCIAAGLPWLSPLPGKIAPSFPTEAGAVLWIDQDSGEQDIWGRSHALIKGLGIPPEVDKNFHLYSFGNPPFHANDPKSVELAIKYAKRIDARLIVIDCLSTTSGGADENKPEMKTVMAGLKTLSVKTGATVAAIHHPPRGSATPRGHSSIDGALDLAIYVNRKTPRDDIITLDGTKFRGAPTAAPIAARFTFESSQEDKRTLESARFYGAGLVEKDPDDMAAGEKAEYWIRQIQPLQMSRTDLLEELKQYGVSDYGMRKAFTTMQENQTLKVEELGEKNAKYYTLQ